MGLFDTVIFTCPHCRRPTERQTKAGPCDLKHYPLHHAPPSIQADVAALPKITCEQCGKHFRVTIQTMVQEVPWVPATDEDP